MRSLCPGKLRLFASPCVAVSLVSRRSIDQICLSAFTIPISSTSTSVSNSPKGEDDGGIRFVYEPTRRFVLGALRKRRQSPPTSTKPRIDLLVEGNPLSTSPARVEPLVEAFRSDTAAALQVVLQRKALMNPRWKMPRAALLSLVLCDDPHIRELNKCHRDKNVPTDVLSFEMDDDLDYKVHLPMKLMGDLVISLDTAERQAAERGHSLLDECRILLVHGLLHMAGYDHERGQEAHEAMAAEERAILAELGWKGKGLISAVDEEGLKEEDSKGEEERIPAEGVGQEKGHRTGKAAGRRGTGGSISAGADAGFLWQEVAGAGDGGGKGLAKESPSGPAAGPSPKAAQKRRGGGAGGPVMGPNSPVSGQRQQYPATLPSSPSRQQQGKEGKIKYVGSSSGSGGGGGGGGAKSSGLRGGPGAARAFTVDSSIGRAGAASCLGNMTSFANRFSVAPVPYAGATQARLLVPGISLGRWLCVAGRASSVVTRCCSCAAGGNSGQADSVIHAVSSASSTMTVDERSSDEARTDSADGYVTSTSSAAPDDSVVQLQQQRRRRRQRTREFAIVALDLDGTLLNSRSRILPSSAAAIRAATAAGVMVVAATGKARPAALAAAASAGLAEPGLLVWPQGPGVFLQGLAVHGRDGTALSNTALPHSVVEAAYRYSAATGVSLCVFLGDTCAAPVVTDNIKELHTTYYEPLAEVVPVAASLLSGPPARKLLFMTDPGTVTNELLPYWTSQLEGSGAQVMQAVPNMLEIVPAGVNKWTGVQRLLDHLGLPPSSLMAVGDGGNDLEMVVGAGLGVAMGNAVPAVREAAAAVVAGHDDGGVAEAFERFIL